MMTKNVNVARMNHYKLLTLLLVVSAAGAVVYGSFLKNSGVASADTITSARTTAGFADSIGVVAHLSDSDYPAGSTIKNHLNYVGISHVRTNNVMNTHDGGYSKGITTSQLLGLNGIKQTFTIPKPSHDAGKTPNDSQIQAAINGRLNYISDNNLKNSTESIEIFNEYDNAEVATWPSVLARGQHYLYTQRGRLNSNAKILGFALVGYKLGNDAAQIQYADDRHLISTYFNQGNLHTYYGVNMPESAYPTAIPGQTHFAPASAPTGPATAFDLRMKYYTYYIGKDKPVVVTELGYVDDPSYEKSVSERAAGVYVPRMVFETFRIGVTRSYIYELLDEPSASPSFQKHFGLFRSNGTPKPSAKAIHNIATLIGGGSDSLRTTGLQIRYNGNTEDLKTVLLQKNANEYWLAMWRAKSVYTKDHRDISVDPDDVTVGFSGNKDMTFYSNLTNDTPRSRSFNHTSYASVPVGAEVTLLKIRSS